MPNNPDDNMAKLVESKANLIQKLREATTNPKPTYEIDGQKVEWGDYLEMLQKAIKATSLLIASEDDWEEISQWYT